MKETTAMQAAATQWKVRPFRDKPTVIVATPVKNEAKHLVAFLQALSVQRDARGRPLARGTFAVILFVNNSSDASAEIARRIGRKTPFEMRVVEAVLPAEHSHAGGARGIAMDLAAASLRETRGGVILTTDADSRVTPNWISANLREFAEGADAVLGTISLDEDGERLPQALHTRGKLEGLYGDLLTEISARLDPEDCNPWPHHATISGASLAVTYDAYLGIGGLPRVPLGEDKALVAALRRRDARIRFSPDAHVITSGRVVGRAPGGVADTLFLRSNDPSALCDEALEPLGVSLKRSLWRGRLRRTGLSGDLRWRRALRLSAGAARSVEAASTFGEAWEAIQQASPALAGRYLSPLDLPAQIERAKRLLSRLPKVLKPIPIELPALVITAKVGTQAPTGVRLPSVVAPSRAREVEVLSPGL